MKVNVKPSPIRDSLKVYTNNTLPDSFGKSKNITIVVVNLSEESGKISFKQITNSFSNEYREFVHLSLPDNVNEKSKSFFEMYFPKKINPSHKLNYYLGCNNELSIILQSSTVTRTFVFQVNSKIRFTVKKRHNEKSLLQGEFTPLQISNPRDYIEKLIYFFE